jgi:hypothetical protein
MHLLCFASSSRLYRGVNVNVAANSSHVAKASSQPNIESTFLTKSLTIATPTSSLKVATCNKTKKNPPKIRTHSGISIQQ